MFRDIENTFFVMLSGEKGQYIKFDHIMQTYIHYLSIIFIEISLEVGGNGR